MGQVTATVEGVGSASASYSIEAQYGATSISKGDEAAFLGLTGVTPVYPTWARTLGQDKPLQDWLRTLTASQIPVLPEDETPWWFDSAAGFCYPGVSAVTEGAVSDGMGGWTGGTKRTVNSSGTPNNNGWACIWRLGAAGMAGLGPGARVILGSSAWSSPVQRRAELHHSTAGAVSEKVGCQEKFLEVRGGYVGNFVIEARPVGGASYNTIAATGSVAPRIERLQVINSQGGIPAPNTEAGAVAGFPSGTVLRKIWIQGAGSSPIMANGPAGDANLLMEDVLIEGSAEGMPALWNLEGTVTMRNFHSRGCGDGGINIEKTRAAGLTVNWTGGSDWVDKPGGGYYNLHVKVGESQFGSVRLNMVDVDVDKGPWPGYVSVQMWGNMGKQVAGAITHNTKPVRYADGARFA